MTIKECIKAKEIQCEVAGCMKRWQMVDVDFINSAGKHDETQFDVRDIGNRTGIDELSQLFTSFCVENGYEANTVCSVTIVKCADSYEELEEV